MNILYFHQHFSTPSGSSGTRSYEMARRLVAAGHKVTVVCGSHIGGTTGLNNQFVKGRRTGVIDGICIIEFQLNYANRDGFIKRSWLFLLFAIKSISVALFQKADLVFATSTPLTAGIPGIVARWIKGTPFIFEVRDLWPELPREMKVITNPVILSLMSFLEWLSYKSAHRLIGLSPGIVEGIIRHNIDANKVTLIPNGCDLDIFASKENSWRPAGVTDDELMAVFTGTHGIANGLDAVLDVSIILKNRYAKKIKIVLVGQGREKEKLRKRAAAENLDNIIFMDPVPKNRLAGLMASADVGLQILANVPAFYYGTSPNKFFDYLSSGLPVLTNYPGWVADLISEHECGFVVPPENANEFANVLILASQNKEILTKMRQNSKTLAEKHFARDKLADQFLCWLEGEDKK